MGSSYRSNNVISFWNIQQEDLTSTLSVPYSIHSLVEKPDGSILAAGLGDARVWLWSLPSQTQIGPPLTGATSLPTSMVFDSTGEKLYLGLQDGTVQVWEMNPFVWMQLACGIERTIWSIGG
jgi:WD40 repeat protein